MIVPTPDGFVAHEAKTSAPRQPNLLVEGLEFHDRPMPQPGVFAGILFTGAVPIVSHPVELAETSGIFGVQQLKHRVAPKQLKNSVMTRVRIKRRGIDVDVSLLLAIGMHGLGDRNRWCLMPGDSEARRYPGKTLGRPLPDDVLATHPVRLIPDEEGLHHQPVSQHMIHLIQAPGIYRRLAAEESWAENDAEKRRPVWRSCLCEALLKQLVNEGSFGGEDAVSYRMAVIDPIVKDHTV